MNQRRETSSRNPIIFGLVLVLVLVLFALYWFVIRDSSDDKTADKGKAPGKVAAKTFAAPGNSFTLEYPGNFAETSGPQGFVWIAGVDTYDILSVKRIANLPTAPDRLAVTIPKTLKAEPGTKIKGHGTEQRDGVDMVTFDIESTSVDGHALEAKLYYFSANGVTWQFGCESQKQAAVINAACAAALLSFQVP